MDFKSFISKEEPEFRYSRERAPKQSNISDFEEMNKDI